MKNSNGGAARGMRAEWAIDVHNWKGEQAGTGQHEQPAAADAAPPSKRGSASAAPLRAATHRPRPTTALRATRAPASPGPLRPLALACRLALRSLARAAGSRGSAPGARGERFHGAASALAALLLLGAAHPAAAQTWNGTTGDFNTGSNWSTAAVPNAAQTATFAGSTPNNTATLSGNTTIGGLTFNAGAAAYTLNAGTSALVVGGLLQNNSGTTQIFVANLASTSQVQMRGTGDVTNSAGSHTVFQLSNGAVLAMVENGNASGAEVVLGAGGWVGASTTSGTTTVGSVAGSGLIWFTNQVGGLNTQTFNIGALNTSTVFTGSFVETAGVTGSLNKVGTGTLTIANTGGSYAGTTTVSAGTLQIGNGGTTGTLGTGTVTVNGGLAFNRSNAYTVNNAINGNSGTITQSGAGNLTLAGAISGDVGITQNGSGSTILTGANSYTGATTITTGTLQVGNGGTTGTLGTGAVVNNGALVFNRSDALSIGNAISGTGTFAKNGAGTLTLTGANTITGTTTINGGTLQAGAANVFSADSRITLFSGTTLDLNNFNQSIGGLVSTTGASIGLGSGTLTVNQSSNGVYQGTITGTGGLTVNGTGGQILILSGTNTYSGATTINASGTLWMGNGTATGTLGDGTGAVVNNGALRFNRSNDATVANAISGTGTIDKNGAGIITLLGANTFSGTTSINAGTLQVGNGGTTGTLGTGAVTNNAALAFNRNDVFTVVNAIGGTGTLAQSGGGTTILTGANSYGGVTTISAGTLQVGNGGTTGTLGTGAVTNNSTLAFNRSDALTVGNAISGTGTLAQSGGGTTILTGTNSYGGTTISAGTLQVGNGGTTGTLGTGAVTNNGSLSFSRSNDVTMANGMSGSGTLIKNGAGILTLTGINTYSGITTISAGTLEIGGGGTFGTGNIVNNGTFAYNRNGILHFNAEMSGTGALTVASANGLILAGNNTYSGITTISSGTLQIASGGTTGTLGTGNVVNNGSLEFARGDAITAANDISGTGRLTVIMGDLTLTGTNTYAGLTEVNGILRVGNGGTTGTLGTGNVTNDGALVFNRSDAVTIANTISGTGTLTKEGGANLILTGINTYAGDTTVSAGTLSVNGSITSAVTVNNGATLGGTGTVGATTIASGGTLAPGNSIGTLTVNGNLTFNAGSIYRVEATPGAADRVNTVGAGTLTIGGGTVDVQAGGAPYARNTTYTILNSAGARTGNFAGATSNLAFLTPTLSYDANNVFLTLMSSAVTSYTSTAGTPNQASVAGYLNGFANNPGNTDAQQLIQRLDNLTAAQSRVAFESLSGSQHGSSSQIGQAGTRGFADAMQGHINGGGEGNGGFGGVSSLKGSSFALSSPATLWGTSGDAPAQMAAMFAGSGAAGGGSTLNGMVMGSDSERIGARETGIAASGGGMAGTWGRNVAKQSGLWGQALGMGGRIASDGNGPGSSYRAGGFMAGYDYALSEQWLVGAIGGYTRTNWDASSNGVAPANGRIETPQAGVYARYSSGPWMVSLAGTYADLKFNTSRTVTIGALNSVASSSHRAGELGASVQVEYALAAGAWQLRPQAGLRYARLSEDGFTESGATPGTNLTVAARTSSNTTLSAGLRALRPFNRASAADGGFELRVVYSHLTGDVNAPISARLAGQAASFTSNGTALKRDALTVGGGVAAKLGRNFSGFADVSMETRGSGQNAYAIGAGVKYVW